MPMVYNLYECALPHGYGIVWWRSSVFTLFMSVWADLCKKFFRKVLGPIMYRTMIVCYGYVFSYLNIVYTQQWIEETSIMIEHELNEISPIYASHVCSEWFECIQSVQICI